MTGRALSRQRHKASTYLRLAARIARSNGGRQVFPYKLTFVVTYWCNYRCQTCNIWQMKPHDELGLDEIERFFERSRDFSWIDFTGGEPFLRKDFVDIVLAALRRCPSLALVHFPTNGYLTDQIVAGVERILGEGPPKLMITVSTDGDEAVNDRVRGIEGGWRRQMETFRRLRELPGVDVVLGMTLSDLNVGEFDRALEAARGACPGLTARDFHLNIAHRSAHYYGNAEADYLDRRDAMLEELRSFARARGYSLGPVGFLEQRYLRHAESYLRTGRTPMRCHALKSSCFIDSWGNVYPCGMYDLRLGSLRDCDYDLGKLWSSPETLRVQRQIWNYDCPQCWTPCEAYQSILGNLTGLGDRARVRGGQRSQL